ncbi:MAG: transposase, partial [Candidatus Magnetoovum sp. WYHC-5]|nr:transposase [Candidatus Magnetoovum sp. WYHC-5]
MGRLTKEDLAQMNEAYFESLDHERLVKVASNLLNLGINLIERLSYWLGLDISVGTIDRCIREAGVACFPVVEQLIEEIQKEELIHIDETP